MSTLSAYYDLITEITIANNEVVTIDPDKPYTITYLIDDRNCNQATGLIRGVVGEDNTIVTISLGAEDVSYANIINTLKIVRIDEYNFNAHFEDFNNWIGIEVTERGRIDLRVRYTSGESIVSVEEGKTYKVSYVEKINGEISLITVSGVVKSIIRSTTKEAMPTHINHFTNDIDYILVMDCASGNGKSDMRSINVTEIRSIGLVFNIPEVDKSELQNIVASTNDIKLDEYTHKSADKLNKALAKAARIMSMTNATSEDVKEAIDDIQFAIVGLEKLSDEYDLIEYDEKANILYCHESKSQVVIRGLGSDTNLVEYFTNFGDRKHFTIPSDVIVYWSKSFNDIREDKPEPENASVIDEEYRFNLVIKNGAKINSLYLASEVVVDEDSKDKDGKPTVINDGISAFINRSLVRTIYMGGVDDSKYTGTNNNLFILDCETDDSNTYAIEEVFMGSNPINILTKEDEESTLYTDSHMTLIINKSDVRDVYCGGIGGVSSYCNLEISNSYIDDIYGTGLCNTTYGCGIRTSKSDINNMIFIGKESTAYSTLLAANSGRIGNIIIGGSEDSKDGTTFITKEEDEEIPNKLKLVLDGGLIVEKIAIGYSNGEKIPKEYIELNNINRYEVDTDEDGLLNN